MSYTIRSTPEFAAGGLVLLGHSVNTQTNGLVEARMSFACLATPLVLARNLQNFAPDSIPPLALPADLAAMPLKSGNVFLVDYSNTVDKGIALIEATYAGISTLSKGQYSESSTTKTASNTVTYSTVTIGPALPANTAVATFDYTAVAVSIQHCSFNINDRKEPTARAENIRNYKNSAGFTSSVSTGGFSAISLFPPQQDIVSVSIEQRGRVYIITESASPEFVNMA
jgi:hypothetical protein